MLELFIIFVPIILVLFVGIGIIDGWRTSLLAMSFSLFVAFLCVMWVNFITWLL